MKDALTRSKSCESKQAQSKKTQPPPELDPCLKFRMGLALMGEENARLYLEWLRLTGQEQLEEYARLYLAWLQAAREKRLREEQLMQTTNKIEVAG